MTGHGQVRFAAAAAAWFGLGVGAVVVPTLWWAALAAAGCVGALWASRRMLRRPAPFVVALVFVLFVVDSRATYLAVGLGVLLLVHVVLADLLDHTSGARPEPVRAALGALTPALILGGAAGPAVALGAAVTEPILGGLGDSWATGLRLAAPFLLLVGVLLALGLATRRPGWGLGDDRGVSALTRRYLDRVAERH